MNASQIKQTIIENTYPVYNANGENIYAGKCVSEGIVNAYDALQHDYTYASDGVSTHKLTCVDCGYACTEEHSMIYESVNAIRHTHKCELCEYSYLEKHTLNYVSISTDKHLVTCQTCGYSAQQNHMMTYTADDLGNNHTGTCTVCNDSFIESHSWTYEYVDTNKHNHVCEECGYSELQNHMESYTATTSLNVHTTTCFVCNQTYNETHTWADMGSYYQCTLCLKTSTSIPGVLMNATGYELTDGQTAVIDSNTILCCIDGEYFLVKAETETEAITYLIEEGTQ